MSDRGSGPKSGPKSDGAAARRDVLAFGIIRGASSVVSFFGAFYLVGIGEAATYGTYLAGFSLAVIISVLTRFGSDHTLLRLSRSGRRGASPEGATLRARVFKTWLTFWFPSLCLAGVAWGAGIPYGLELFNGVMFSAAVVAGRYLRSAGRPRPAPLMMPPFMHFFGVGLLCLGATPDMALWLGGVLWVATCAAIFLRTMGARAPGRILRAPMFLRIRPRRLGLIFFSYTIEASFYNGVNLLIQHLYGPAALAIFNTIMKLNFISEQSQEFQRIFRLGTGRAQVTTSGPNPAAKAAGPADGGMGGDAGGRGGLKGRLRDFLQRLDGGRRSMGSGPLELIFFSAAAATGNAIIMLLLLRHDFEMMPAWAFYILLTIGQTLSIAAGPAMYAILTFRSLAMSNVLRIGYILAFVGFLYISPEAPELWVLANVFLLAAVRYVALWYWRRGDRLLAKGPGD